ncbi:UDP-N-acetylmuramate dehydrogenase [Candidatus Woesebacteria bacterium]|nr:UDP-N-acetylmuramate dehydrogenase [Candidatus Woesebacteria bacterium]
MKILKDHSLKKINAFHVDVKAKYIAYPKSEDEVIDLLSNKKFKNLKKVVIGEGSGTLFTKDLNGIVIKVATKGIETFKEDNDMVLVKACSGEIWDHLVEWSVNRNYQGIENMSGIPGTVGAAPVQNIAAYGQDFAEVFESLSAIDLKSGQKKVFKKSELEFGYRDSIFKNKHKNRYVITEVTIKLNKNPQLVTDYYSRYESIKSELEKMTKEPYTLNDVRNAVIKIRDSKFPDWKVYGNTGSFFKNPFVTKTQLNNIQKKYPEVQYYPTEKMQYPKLSSRSLKEAEIVKIAAGWLLEELGWKGKRIGNVATSPNQALVIINYGNATADEIINFAKKMKKDFFSHFGVQLEYEVKII